MKKKHAALLALLGVFVILIVALAIAGNYFYSYALTSRRGQRAPGVPDSEMGAARSWDSAGNWLAEYAHEQRILSHDGLTLHAYRVDAAGPAGHGYAILAHGYTADARSMASFGKHIHGMGFTVLMPDMRGHGLSEGRYIGMGWHDRLDMLRWIEAIVREDADAEILLFGISMGGATVMMTAGEDLPPNVKAIVEDCGYTSVWDEFTGQLRAQFGLPPFPIMHAASAVTRLRAGYWLAEADATRQVAKSVTPILFIHGEADTFVPFWMLDTLYEAAGCEKQRLAVPGAGHGMASAVDPEGYWNAVEAFTGRYIPARNEEP